jgi:aspartate kinase
MIVQNMSEEGYTDIAFTVLKTDLKKSLGVIKNIGKSIGARKVFADEKIAKISIVGVGMKSHSGVAAQMFDALASKKVNIDIISTSEIKISCVIAEKDADKAARAIHSKFKLGKRADD